VVLEILRAHLFADAVGRHQYHVQIRARHDALEMDVEAVRKDERPLLAQPGDDDVSVKLRLLLVRNQQHHDIGLGDRHRRFRHAEPRGFGRCTRYRTRTQADDDVDTGILEVERLCPPLGAKAQDRDAAGPNQ